jgi:uncharacterized protein with PQ loop repeat
VLGWLGSLLLAFCSIPQAYKSFNDKHSRGISWGFILMWTTGEICTLIYILQDQFAWPLLFNYGINCVFCLVILWYKLEVKLIKGE